MRIAVTGGRDFCDKSLVEKILSQFDKNTEMCHGAARGADTLCAQYASDHGWNIISFPADWKTHGNRAGPIRNRQMVNTFLPELLVAFPGGRGTQDMINYCQQKGIPIIYAV